MNGLVCMIDGRLPEDLKANFSFVDALAGIHNGGEGVLVRQQPSLHHGLDQAYRPTQTATTPKAASVRTDDKAETLQLSG